jgi:hypothetical protein
LGRFSKFRLIVYINEVDRMLSESVFCFNNQCFVLVRNITI